MVPPSVVTPVMAECRRAPPVAPRHRLACAHCRQMRILFSGKCQACYILSVHAVSISLFSILVLCSRYCIGGRPPPCVAGWRRALPSLRYRPVGGEGRTADARGAGRADLGSGRAAVVSWLPTAVWYVPFRTRARSVFGCRSGYLSHPNRGECP